MIRKQRKARLPTKTKSIDLIQITIPMTIKAIIHIINIIQITAITIAIIKIIIIKETIRAVTTT